MSAILSKSFDAAKGTHKVIGHAARSVMYGVRFVDASLHQVPRAVAQSANAVKVITGLDVVFAVPDLALNVQKLKSTAGKERTRTICQVVLNSSSIIESSIRIAELTQIIGLIGASSMPWSAAALHGVFFLKSTSLLCSTLLSR